MYESPIEIIQTQIQMQMDGEILKAVQGVGIDVNKEELIKALAYDREQYVKGYKDGYRDGFKDFARVLKEKDGYNNHTFDDCASIFISEEYRKGRDEKIKEIWNTIDCLKKEMEGGENA